MSVLVKSKMCRRRTRKILAPETTARGSATEAEMIVSMDLRDGAEQTCSTTTDINRHNRFE